MKKVLITGFDPFGGEKINPACEAVKLLPDEIGGAKIIKKEIPTVFQKGPEAVYEEIQSSKPDYVLCIGQAGGRSQSHRNGWVLTLEMQELPIMKAINRYRQVL